MPFNNYAVEIEMDQNLFRFTHFLTVYFFNSCNCNIKRDIIKKTGFYYAINETKFDTI